MSDARVVLMTAGSAEEAAAIVSTLVEENLIACGNVIPGVTSIYRWQGTVERAAEVLVIMKTAAAAYPALEARIRELHSYEVPEILELPVERGAQAYLEWLFQSVGK